MNTLHISNAEMSVAARCEDFCRGFAYLSQKTTARQGTFTVELQVDTDATFKCFKFYKLSKIALIKLLRSNFDLGLAEGKAVADHIEIREAKVSRYLGGGNILVIEWVADS